MRPRSRSPFNRDRLRRDRSPFRRSPPAGPRGGSYRPRSRSIDRRNNREDRYPGPPFRRPSIPPRDSVNSSAINSRSASGPSSPRPGSHRARGGSRSRQQTPSRVATPTTGAATPAPPPQATQAPPEPALAHRGAEKQEASSPLEPSELRETPENTDSVKAPRQQIREPPKQPAATQDVASTPARSPPKGPAALRAPPTGPAAGRNFTSPLPQHAQPHRPAQTPTGPSRSDMTSPTIPPAGPRGYIPPRGGGGAFSSRGGRGGGSWNTMPPRHMPGPSVSPTIPSTGPTGIPTGPRAGNNSVSNNNSGGNTGPPTSSSSTSSPSLGTGKPFNPPTGPAAHAQSHPHSHSHNHHNHNNHHHNSIPPQRSLAQNLLSNMPPLLNSGKVDPELSHIALGVTKELEPHFRKLIEDEERQREDLKLKQEKLRKSLKVWDRLERESKAFELKSDLSEKSLQNLAGEGGGSAF
ncbi:hypothetical protein QBC37DRAFT_280012 [Rhypophila decipiens]|uniref:Serine/arginine repetitive matrix protein 1 n=1 Tax=Rhypophila decipiens TaxID=261697 RepID=A0AAN7BA62_9PEZI|nr:hypothetical protein QBC37DRAFT_280012 [Rhypophila decipiens]